MRHIRSLHIQYTRPTAAGRVCQRSLNWHTNTDIIDAALTVWLEIWNTDSEIVRRIYGDDFPDSFQGLRGERVEPGWRRAGPESFARFLDVYPERHPGAVFTEIVRAMDGAHGRLLRNVHAGEVAAGGSVRAGSELTQNSLQCNDLTKMYALIGLMLVDGGGCWNLILSS